MIVTYDSIDLEEDKYHPKNEIRSDNVEIIDLTDKTFKYSFNEERINEKSSKFGLVGGLLKNQPFIGGLVTPGNPQQNCIILKNPKKTTYPLLTPTKGKPPHASKTSIVLNQKTLWVTNGLFNISEFVSVDEPTIKGPKLTWFDEYGHTMVQIDPKTIYIIGGGYRSNQKNTFIVDPNRVDKKGQLILQFAPAMNHKRMHHCSSKMKIDDKVILVVVGGSCHLKGSKNAYCSSEFHGLCLRK